jgi:hypothetical protein
VEWERPILVEHLLLLLFSHEMAGSCLAFVGVRVSSQLWHSYVLVWSLLSRLRAWGDDVMMHKKATSGYKRSCACRYTFDLRCTCGASIKWLCNSKVEE